MPACSIFFTLVAATASLDGISGGVAEGTGPAEGTGAVVGAGEATPPATRCVLTRFLFFTLVATTMRLTASLLSLAFNMSISSILGASGARGGEGRRIGGGAQEWEGGNVRPTKTAREVGITLGSAPKLKFHGEDMMVPSNPFKVSTQVRVLI
jgi:hypothetical protein